MNIWISQANTIGPYLVYSLGYHSVSPRLRLLDCQVFQWENQRAQDKRIPRKMSTIMINSAVGYLGEILTQRAESLPLRIIIYLWKHDLRRVRIYTHIRVSVLGYRKRETRSCEKQN